MNNESINGDTKLVQLGFNLVKIAETLVPLKSIKVSYLQHLLGSAVVQTVFNGDCLVRAGSVVNEHMYLLNGEVEYRFESGALKTVNASDTALPLAYLQSQPCTIVATSDSTLLKIDSEAVDRALAWSQIAQYLMSEVSLQREMDEDVGWMHTVLDSNLFHKAPPVNVEQIFSRLTPMVVDAGEVIIRQGEIGDCCYFIKEGKAEVKRYDENSRAVEKVADISEGRCFGEDALVYEQARNANVEMVTNGVLMRLEKSDFLLLLKEPNVAQISIAAANALDEPPILIDVRTDDEYFCGHLPHSGSVPLNLLNIKKRLLDPQKHYLMYCDTGRRSRAAAYLLNMQGYKVIALEQGLIGQKMLKELVDESCYILREGELVAGQ